MMYIVIIANCWHVMWRCSFFMALGRLKSPWYRLASEGVLDALPLEQFWAQLFVCILLWEFLLSAFSMTFVAKCRVSRRVAPGLCTGEFSCVLGDWIGDGLGEPVESTCKGIYVSLWIGDTYGSKKNKTKIKILRQGFTRGVDACVQGMKCC